MLTRVLIITVAGLGVLLGVIAMVVSPGLAVGGAGFGAFIGVLGWMWLREPDPGDPEITQLTRRRAGMIVGTVVTAGWLALTGLTMLLGPVSVPVLAVLLLSAVVMWWWRRPGGDAAPQGAQWRAARDRLLRVARRPDPPRRITTRRRGPPGHAPTRPPAPLLPSSVPVPANLSTLQLCVAWQRTYFVLLSFPVGGPRGELVALRSLLLDEIESRDPDGFTRWLDTGARAGSDPGRYLTGDR